MADGGVQIGLLGGTFDPVHLAHLRLAEEAREQLGLLLDDLRDDALAEPLPETLDVN